MATSRLTTGVGILGLAMAALAAWGCHHRPPEPSSPPASVSAGSPESQPCPIQLHDATSETGITFRHTDGSSGRYYIMETVCTGLATFDYDGDGLIDIYFPNGAPLPGAPKEPRPRHALYRNLGGFRFREVTDQARVGCTGYGLGAAVGDYDNDGWPDLYVSNFGPKVLYRNNGDGTFTETTRQAGVADGNKVGAGVCFLDADGDGLLDLYVANYLKFIYESHVSQTRQGFREYSSPKLFPPEQHALFRNRGDGTFADASVEAGIAQVPGLGMGIVSADYDNDGDTDIFVLNDASRNYFWKNDGRGHFEEVALMIGCAYNASGESMASMGVDCGDFDNDGWLDFFQTSYQRETPLLFRNLGDGTLEDVTIRARVGEGTVASVKWGCGFADFDNDGHRDLFIAFGHLQDQIDQYDSTTSYHARNVVLRNKGDGTFVNVSDQCGDGLAVKLSSRGAALDDLDNDGDIDVVVLNSRREPTIIRNMLCESGAKRHWLQLRLRGTKTARDAVGAHVRVVAGDLVQVDEVHGGRGYQGHFGSRLHFGLGEHGRVDRIEVHWLGGGADVLENVAADRLLVIDEGGSR